MTEVEVDAKLRWRRCVRDRRRWSRVDDWRWEAGWRCAEDCCCGPKVELEGVQGVWRRDDRGIGKGEWCSGGARFGDGLEVEARQTQDEIERVRNWLAGRSRTCDGASARPFPLSSF